MFVFQGDTKNALVNKNRITAEIVVRFTQTSATLG